MKFSFLAAAAATASIHFASAAAAQTFSATPINDLGAGLYLDQYPGGLYPGGSNAVPAAHAAVGLTRAQSVTPLNPQGQPDPQGKFVVTSIGMSNTAQEWAGGNSSFNAATYSFMGQAAAHPAVNGSSMVLYNGARGGQSAGTWDQFNDTNYTRVQQELTQAGLSEAQVRVAWLKVANPGPMVSLPAPNADANLLVQQMGNIVRVMKQHYPNLEMVFVSSRIYAGYATTTLNPEPYAYESGFAVKRLVEAQVNQMDGGAIDSLAGDLDYSDGTAPWIGWGPYLWADGPRPRSDALVWLREDFAADGTHPSVSGRTKVGRLLMQEFVSSRFAQDWFLDFARGDASLDGTVNLDDFNILAANFGQTDRTWEQGDFTYDGRVNLDDFNALAGNFGLAAGGGGPSADDWARLASAIPEPSAGGLAVMAIITLSHRSRPRDLKKVDVTFCTAMKHLGRPRGAHSRPEIPRFARDDGFGGGRNAGHWNASPGVVASRVWRRTSQRNRARLGRGGAGSPRSCCWRWRSDWGG